MEYRTGTKVFSNWTIEKNWAREPRVKCLKFRRRTMESQPGLR